MSAFGKTLAFEVEKRETEQKLKSKMEKHVDENAVG